MVDVSSQLSVNIVSIVKLPSVLSSDLECQTLRKRDCLKRRKNNGSFWDSAGIHENKSGERQFQKQFEII